MEEMSLIGFIILVVIAAIAGAIGQALAGYSRGGFLFTIVIGFVGAYLGTWLAGQLGLPQLLIVNVDGQSFPLFWAIIGAALLTFIFGALARPRRRHRAI
jgi:uncharacterized membrane protein YeaQ/YmgE (transglycosylase-associated protein family)